MNWPSKMFITGTDTGIGKTFVATLLLSGLRCGYWKPVQSGSAEGTDTAWVRRMSCLGGEHFFPEAYVFSAPFSPYQAALREGREIDLNTITVPRAERLLIEGAGGVLVPLTKTQTMLDLMVRLNFPVLVVAPGRLGMINQTLLTLECLQRAKLSVVGVVVNGGEEDGEIAAILRDFAGVKMLAQIPSIKKTEITPADFIRLYASLFLGKEND